MNRIVRQAIRGCGTLPHVGGHPGTLFLVMFVLMGGISGLHGGWQMMIGGALFMLVPMGAIYLAGAIDRANTSDRIEAKKARGASHD